MIIDEQIENIDITTLDGQRAWRKICHKDAVKFLLNIEGILPEIEKVAEARFLEGYALYGHEMYEKDAEATAVDIVEEFADALEYVKASFWRIYKDDQSKDEGLQSL